MSKVVKDIKFVAFAKQILERGDYERILTSTGSNMGEITALCHELSKKYCLSNSKLKSMIYSLQNYHENK